MPGMGAPWGVIIEFNSIAGWGWGGEGGEMVSVVTAAAVIRGEGADLRGVGGWVGTAAALATGLLVGEM